MDVIYRRGEATAAEIHKLLDDPPTLTTVRGLLRILEEKGQVLHAQDGNRYVYRPIVNRDAAGAQVLPHVVRTFFGGSAARAMAALLGPDGIGLEDAELERLSLLVEEARKRAS
jgi:BlaI family penicillinase repressor